MTDHETTNQTQEHEINQETSEVSENEHQENEEEDDYGEYYYGEGVHPGRPESATIDFCDVLTKDDLHDLFMKELPFPKWYGRNWDAFWDLLRSANQEPYFPKRIVFKNAQQLASILPRDHELLCDSFQSLKDEHPDVQMEVVGLE